MNTEIEDSQLETSINRLLATVKTKSQAEIDAHNLAESNRAARHAKWKGWVRKNLPFRNAIQKVDCSGVFGEKLASVASKLGTGVTIAIIGLQGRGKTQLGVELLRNNPGFFTTGVEIGMKLRSFDTSEERMKELCEYPLLVIDEAFKKQESEWISTQFFCLLNKRHEAMRDTILIDSLTQDELGERCGASVIDRMRQSGGIVLCNWQSYRDDYKTPANLAEELAGYNEARRAVKQ